MQQKILKESKEDSNYQFRICFFFVSVLASCSRYDIRDLCHLVIGLHESQLENKKNKRQK